MVIHRAPSTSYSVSSLAKASTASSFAVGRPRPGGRPTGVRRGSGAGVRLRRVGRGVQLEARRADGVVERLLPRSVVHHLLDGGVDRLAERGVALLDAD